jgi:hypothetical protein
MDFLNTIPLVRSVWNWVNSRIGVNREHDIALFKKLDALADETCLDKILNNSIFISYFHSEEDDILRHLIDALKRTENQFLESVVRLRAQELLGNWRNYCHLFVKPSMRCPQDNT